MTNAATDVNISSGESLEPDSRSETDSALGSEAESTTQSLTPSTFDYRFEHGRRYHAYADGEYHIPNDEIEADRLNLQHHLFRMTMGGKLHLAPLSQEVQEVLDVGCGTGMWAIDFADMYPSSRVLGIDLSPIQPTEVPPNCSFLIDNLEAEWYHDHKFDYIHSRAMIAGFKDWPKFFRQAYNALKPGGYIELQDVVFPWRCDDGTAPPDSSIAEWARMFTEAASKARLNVERAGDFVTPLQEAGFGSIHGQKFKWPIGPWPKGRHNKRLGKWALEDLLQGLQGGILALLTRFLGWSKEQVELFLVEVRRDLRAQKQHFYMPVVFIYARKPLEATSSDAEHKAFTSDDEGPQLEAEVEEKVEEATEAMSSIEVAASETPAHEPGTQQGTKKEEPVEVVTSSMAPKNTNASRPGESGNETKEPSETNVEDQSGTAGEERVYATGESQDAMDTGQNSDRQNQRQRRPESR